MNEHERLLWLDKRRKCITGTDIAAIVGLSKYASPLTVFMDKLALSEPVIENEPMRWGKLLEPVIMHRYAQENGVDVTPGVFMVKDGIIGGTPDGLTEAKLIEIKTAGLFSAKFWGEPGTDQIPDSYLCQVQWYMNLTDREKCDIAVLIGGQDYRVYHAHRNQNLIDLLVDSANDFWNSYIVPETPPPLDASKGADDYLKSFFPTSRGNIIRATHDMDEIARDLSKARDDIARAEEIKTKLENQLKYAIGDNDGIESRYFKATWKSTKSSEKVDYAALVKSLDVSPELVAEFTKVNPGYRRFTLTINDAE